MTDEYYKLVLFKMDMDTLLMNWDITSEAHYYLINLAETFYKEYLNKVERLESEAYSKGWADARLVQQNQI